MMESPEVTLYIVNSYNLQVTFHPKFREAPSLQYKYSITELEFGVFFIVLYEICLFKTKISDSLNDTEAVIFNQTVIKYLLGAINVYNIETNNNSNLSFFNGNYTKNGQL